MKSRASGKQSSNEFQMTWAANVVVYVNYINDTTSATTVSKTSKKLKLSPDVLKKEVPIYGPAFYPPSFVNELHRSESPEISPAVMYLKPLHILRPFYYPELVQCPCSSKDIQWRGWTATGYREVHGVSRDETALGMQLRCNTCKATQKGHGNDEEKVQQAFSLTNFKYWENKHHWEVPRKFWIGKIKGAQTHISH